MLISYHHIKREPVNFVKFCKFICLFLIPRYRCINSDDGDDNDDNGDDNDGDDDVDDVGNGNDDDDDDLAATPTTL